MFESYLGRIVFAGGFAAAHGSRMPISWMWSFCGRWLDPACSDLKMRATNQRSQPNLHTQENQE